MNCLKVSHSDYPNDARARAVKVLSDARIDHWVNENEDSICFRDAATWETGRESLHKEGFDLSFPGSHAHYGKE
jgi:hypothetical protein